MCVVNDKQVSPIWINHNTLIRVRASLPLGMYGHDLSLGTLEADGCIYKNAWLVVWMHAFIGSTRA